MHGHVLSDYENPSSKLISRAIAFPLRIFLILSMLNSFFGSLTNVFGDPVRIKQILINGIGMSSETLKILLVEDNAGNGWL